MKRHFFLQAASVFWPTFLLLFIYAAGAVGYPAE
jgi:hypothetical protein